MTIDTSVMLPGLGLILLSAILLALGYCETELPRVSQAYALAGGQALLNCTASTPTGHVSWHRPHDGLQVSHDRLVSSGLEMRYRIVGDPRTGEHSLLLRSVQYPADNGTWTCSVYEGARVQVHLTVLVTPTIKEPQINPISGILFQVHNDAYTFTCSASHAYPPVTLTWIKQNGPLMEYDPQPPTFTPSSDGTLATTTALVLTPRNHGSQFACQASHPTFMGKVYTKEIDFIVADSAYDPNEEAASMASIGAPSLGPGGLGIIVVSAVLLVLAATSGLLLCKLRKHWSLNTPGRHHYNAVPTNYTHAASNGNVVHPVTPAQTEEEKQERLYRCQIVAGVGLLSVVIACLAYTVPVYIAGFPAPVQGVDEMVVVLSGSLLWLDCSSLAKKSDDLLAIGWRKDHYKFYIQYNSALLAPNYGIALNTTPAVTERAGRTQSHGLGQIAVWPTSAQDQGLYMCEVARIVDNSGGTTIHRKLFAVGILTDLPLNYCLMALTLLALIAALILAVLLACRLIHVIHRARPPAETQTSTSTETTDVEIKVSLTKPPTVTFECCSSCWG